MLTVKDTYRHKGLRRQLIGELRKKGIKDEHILEVMGTLPRHFFLDRTFEEWAYLDKPFPIGNDQTISQPFTVAYMTSLLEIKKRDRVMEIGTGSGYQAAVLALLGARVFTIERQELLYRRAKKLLSSMGAGNIRFFFRDGHLGLPEHAPFDKILVTAGAEDIPKPLMDQLRIGGIMVIPVGKEDQHMLRIARVSEKEYQQEELGNFRFVPFKNGLNEL